MPRLWQREMRNQADKPKDYHDLRRSNMENIKFKAEGANLQDSQAYTTS